MADPLETVRKALPKGYEIERYLNGGGQGQVFLGKFNGQSVAIKFFQPTTDDKRLQREIEALETIDSPYLVKVKAYSEIQIDGISLPIVAYEFLPGGDLCKHLAPDAPPVPLLALATIGTNVATGTEELWAKRIVHRDIKPGNIVCSDETRYVLVDVGFARHLDRSAITAPGGSPGTSGYKSPEQAAGRRSLTINSDTFSLGLTLYELAAKRHPFDRIQEYIGRRIPPELSTLRPDLPAEFVRLVHQMLSVSPSMRPSGLGERFSRFLKE